MHICHVITRLIVGGAQENTLLTCRGLLERGHRVTLIAGSETGPEGSLWQNAAEILRCAQNDDVRAQNDDVRPQHDRVRTQHDAVSAQNDADGARYGMQSCSAQLVRLDSLVRAVRPWTDWTCAKELETFFGQLRPDVVHTHSSKAGILARRAAHRASVPTVVHTIHGMSFNRTQPRAVQRLYRTLERRAAKHTSAFICVADAMREQAVAAGLAPPERFTTIRSGIETDRFAPDPDTRRQCRESWGVRSDDIVVGTIARLFRDKGYDELIEAMPIALRYHDRLKFVWIGSGPYRKTFEGRLARRGLLDRVCFTGLVPPDDIPNAVNGFDVLLHASRWEGLPRAVVQALLTEVPVVCVDADGAPEVVIPGQTGLLVPLGDAAALAAGIVALAKDRSLRQRLGKQGRFLCLGRFDWRKMVSEIEALYQNLAVASPAVV